MTSVVQPISFTRGIPPVQLLPHDEMLAWSTGALDTYGTASLQYGSSRGFLPLREWLSHELKHPAEQIFAGNGSMNLLAYLTAFLLRPGDHVIVENPTYDRARHLFDLAGAIVHGVPQEADGIDVNQLAEVITTYQPKFLYLITEFNNPSGARTSATKRAAIAELARQHNVLLIDDGAYYRLRFEGDPLKPLRDYAPEHTITLGSFTKLLAPGVRTGWALLPDRFCNDFASFIEDRMIAPGTFAQSVVSYAVRTPEYAAYLQRLISVFRQQRDIMTQLLTEHLAPLGASWVHAQGGYFIGLTLPPTSKDIWDAVPADKLILLNGDRFFAGQQHTNFVRLPFASLSADDMESGIRTIAATFKEVTRT